MPTSYAAPLRRRYADDADAAAADFRAAAADADERCRRAADAEAESCRAAARRELPRPPTADDTSAVRDDAAATVYLRDYAAADDAIINTPPPFSHDADDAASLCAEHATPTSLSAIAADERHADAAAAERCRRAPTTRRHCHADERRRELMTLSDAAASEPPFTSCAADAAMTPRYAAAETPSAAVRREPPR